MNQRFTTSALATLLLAVLVVGPAAQAQTETETTTPSTVRLSDEKLLSRWAYPVDDSAIYRRADDNSGKVGQLRFFTEDRFPEVYLLLRRHTDAEGRVWIEVRIPKKPNGKVGWVPRDSLGPYNRNVFQITISRKTFRATLRKHGKKIWSARIGVGAVGTKTPPGRFYIREKFRFKNSAVYGTHALGTSAYAPISDWPNGGVVGIHGTSRPELIPGRPSHGCIRVRNENMSRLWHLVPVGTPVRIY